jgi:chromosome partitioning protein
MQPSPTDLWATSTTTEFAQSEKIKAKILLNRYNPQSKLTKEIIAQIPGSLFKCSLGNRVAFSSCFLSGVTVTECAPNSIAAEEIRSLSREVLAIFDTEKTDKGEPPRVYTRGI